jgi:hypothetical protein
MNLTFRPLPAWPYPEQPKGRDLFKASYSRTLHDLEREIGMLHGSEIIVGLVMDASQVRFDGRMRADARVTYPGVELSFEVPDGRRLVFHTDVHRGYVDSWQSNLRAITLGLEALRAVDRYGITSTAEQYAGFLQLTTSEPSVERGHQLVSAAGGIRQALKVHHPDSGGDPRAFADVQAYRQANGARS